MPGRQLSCEEFVRQLPDLLDGEVDRASEELLRHHLSWCVRCLRKHAFERRVLETIGARLRPGALPDGLASRITELLQAARPDRDAGPNSETGSAACPPT